MVRCRKAAVGLLVWITQCPYWITLLNTSKSAHGFSSVLKAARSARARVPSRLHHSAVPLETTATSFSDAASWHRERRRQMLDRYGDQIAPLERDASSQKLALPLLILSNLSLLSLAIASGSLPVPMVVLLAAFPGSMFSLWQLQILHDVLHGSLFQKGRKTIYGVKRRDLQDRVLFFGSMPSVFGYYLYLKYGHLTHHKNVGDPTHGSLSQLFDSNQADFEDGDVLFVAHRLKLKGDIGPRFQVFGKELKMSISKSGFNAWKEGNAVWNAAMFACSFLFERAMLVVNDAIVALTGRNLFFPNKPQSFHNDCAKYARCATLIRGMLWATVGWKSLLFLYLAETLWSIPPHPACAMFVTNHGSSINVDGSCVPTSSTYAGRWYSIFTLGTNYHCEHHDFPTIPLDKLGQLRTIAPEFYPSESNDDLLQIMRGAFAHPDYYACMDAGMLRTDSA